MIRRILRASAVLLMLIPLLSTAAPASAATLAKFNCAFGIWDTSGGTEGPYSLGMGQSVDVVVRNNNVVGLTVSVDELNWGTSQSAVIAPYSSHTFSWSAFGAEPLSYRFRLRTASTSVIARYDFNSYFCGLQTGKVTSDLSGKCMRSYSGKAVIWDCGSAGSWTWGYSTQLYGWDMTIRAGGKCLDVAGTAAGSKAILATCDQYDYYQQWRELSDRTIRNGQSGLCLVDPNGSTVNGTQLEARACDSSKPQQRWTLPSTPIVLS
jgi:hypothetical protein